MSGQGRLAVDRVSGFSASIPDGGAPGGADVTNLGPSPVAHQLHARVETNKGVFMDLATQFSINWEIYRLVLEKRKARDGRS